MALRRLGKKISICTSCHGINVPIHGINVPIHLEKAEEAVINSGVGFTVQSLLAWLKAQVLM